MKLSAPKGLIWWIALILAALGIVSKFVGIPFVSANNFWFVAVGYVLLFLGTLFKGL